MVRKLKSFLLSAPEPGPQSRAVDWPEVERLARRLPRKANLVVPKGVLAAPPPYSRSRLGRPRGALRQYRCLNFRGNLHVKEFERHWVVHVDSWNPLRHPVKHLLVDHGYKTFLHLHEFLEALAEPSPVPVPDAA